MMTLLAFITALALLIAVHEYGHYRVARACGVKVLRFSIGFGRPLLRWQRPGLDTEFVIGAFPVGGYVKMLDEREAPVPPEQRHLAFNTQPLRVRAAIVAAGPLANLLLAVLLYAGVNWIGTQEPAARLASPVADSVAARAGLVGGERVEQAAATGDPLQPVRSFEELRWLLTQAAIEAQDVRLQLRTDASRNAHEVTLVMNGLGPSEVDEQLLRRIGLIGPWTEPLIGELVAGQAGDRAGLKAGDKVLAIGQTHVLDGQQLRRLIRESVQAGQPATQDWRVLRDGREMVLPVTPDLKPEAERSVGRIGAWVGSPPELVTVQYGLIEGFGRALQRTWEVSGLSLRMIGHMLTGQASLKNLSGPLTIAEYAGKSASMGLTAYVLFLALISVSLGVLNLLPLPVLDGGHLMYYLWEAVAGRSLPERWLERLQRAGVALLLAMMAVALFNDVTRLLG